MGVDPTGRDPRGAALRAVRDALARADLHLFETLGIDRDAARCRVTVALPVPDGVRAADLSDDLPFPDATVRIVEGGLRTEAGPGATLVVTAAVEVFLPIDLARRHVGGSGQG